jgi:hypothetical protein
MEKRDEPRTDAMNDQRFLSILNSVSQERGFHVPVLKRGESPSSGFLEDWAEFLETCVRKGLVLSDPRWQRVAIESNSPHSQFTLEAGGSEPSEDSDFRVGLQLLLGMLDPDNSSS